jgi:hypothetical protein
VETGSTFVNTIARIFSHPALVEAPPVLIDVGASGGWHPAWRRIAPYSIGLGFEPDSREREALGPAQRRFKRWIFCDKIVVPERGRDAADIHLTASPYCSSTLPPDETSLAEWSFSKLFAVQGTRRLGATTLADALAKNGLDHVDWLKCDTQGTDLRTWQCLPAETRTRALAVEFEPGLIDAYRGEDKFHHVLSSMDKEPFWLAQLDVHGAPRGTAASVERIMGPRMARYYSRYGPSAPGWVNALYLNIGKGFSLRDSLLLWVFATGLGHHLFASELATSTAERHGDGLAKELAAVSAGSMRRSLWATWPRWPRLAWGKVFGS